MPPHGQLIYVLNQTLCSRCKELSINTSMAGSTAPRHLVIPLSSCLRGLTSEQALALPWL